MPFFKPRRSAENCKQWIKACGRSLEQMNMNIVDKNRHLFVPFFKPRRSAENCKQWIKACGRSLIDEYEYC